MQTRSVCVFVLLAVTVSSLSAQSAAQQPSSTGHVSFARAITFPSGVSFPSGIASGDFNNDGIPDLAIGTITGGAISVALGQGDGRFGSWLYSSTGDSPDVVTVGRFDGKNLGAAVNGFYGCNTLALYGAGDGYFSGGQPLSSDGNCVFGFAVGDFNGDHKDDLAANAQVSPSGCEVYLYLSNGEGTFFQAPRRFKAGDGYEFSSIVAGDFNNDGKLDLAVLCVNLHNGVGSIAVLLGDGKGEFEPPIFYRFKNLSLDAVPSALAVGDFNHDKKLDLAVAFSNYSPNKNSDVQVLLGNGDGTFRKGVRATAGRNPVDIAAADFNGDGKLDLVVSSLSVDTSPDSISVLLGNGDGTFQRPARFLVRGIQPLHLTVADFNGDGKPDVATVNMASDSVSVLLNTTRFPSKRAP